MQRDVRYHTTELKISRALSRFILANHLYPLKRCVNRYIFIILYGTVPCRGVVARTTHHPWGI